MVELSSILGKSRLTYTGSPHKWDELLGVELELENVVDPTTLWTVAGWTTHQDQSLRNGMEFVTHPAQGGETLESSIRNFYDRKFQYDNGPRTSTHIHINMRDATDEVLSSMVMIVYMIEDGIYQSVEESRKWGGYSVALAEMPTSRLRSLLSPSSQNSLLQAIAPTRNADRYYGMNTNMNRHGTVEFRYFPGGPTQKELHSWVDLVVAIKKAAKKYNKEALMSLLISPEAVVNFLRNEFGSWADRLLGAVGPERMFNSFAEVATMAGDDDPRELASGVLWVSPHYLNFLGKTMFKNSKGGMAYLSNILKHSNVLSKADWNYYLSQARNVDSDPFIAAEEMEYNEEYEYDEPPSPDGDDFVAESVASSQRRFQEMLDLERARLATRRASVQPADTAALRWTLPNSLNDFGEQADIVPPVLRPTPTPRR